MVDPIYGRDMIPLYPQEWSEEPPACPCGRSVTLDREGTPTDLCSACHGAREQAQRDAHWEAKHDLWNDERGPRERKVRP